LLILFLWFSIVSYNNYGGDSKPLFYFYILFLVRNPVAILVVTDGDSTRDFRELSHLIKYTKLMWLFQFFFVFFFSLFFFISFFSSYIYFFCFILFYFSFIIIIVYIFVNFG